MAFVTHFTIKRQNYNRKVYFSVPLIHHFEFYRIDQRKEKDKGIIGL